MHIVNDIGAKSLYKSFFDVLKYSNYKILKCFKLAFSSSIFKNNKVNIIVLSFFGVYSIFMVIYAIKGASLLKKDIFEINNEVKNNNDKKLSKINLDNEAKFKPNLNLKSKDDKKKNEPNLNLKSKDEKKKNEPKDIDNNKIKRHSKKKRRNRRRKFHFPPKKNLSKRNNNKIDNNELSNIDKNKTNVSINKLTSKTKESERINNIQKQIGREISPKTNKEKEKEKLDSYEVNNLEYDEALKRDKRKFWEMYCSIIKREQLIIFAFFVRDDHNITFVKYSRFIFFVCTDMALNVFFFSDETMHKMFLDYGKYNFVQQIPQIIYSTIVSQLIEVFICYLSLTDKHYYEIKRLNIKSNKEILRKIKCIKIKICFFYAFTGLVFFFYWYLITCFCAVYENTQSAFIKD